MSNEDYISLPTPDRETWLALRAQLDAQFCIGASEIAAVCGLSRYDSAYSLAARKLGLLPPVDESEPMRWGLKLERVIAEAFCEETGMQLREVNEIRRSKPHPWMITTLDFEVSADGETWAPLECKNTGEWAARNDEWGPSGTDEVPERHYLQVQHQLAVSWAQHAYLAVLVGGNRLRWYDIPKRNEIISQIEKRGGEFHAMLTRGELPEPDGSDASTDAVNALAEHRDDMVEPTQKHWAIHSELVALQAEKKAMEEREKELKNRLRFECGPMAGIKGVCTYKKQVAHRIDTHLLKTQHPALAEALTRPQESHVLRITKPKKQQKEAA